MSKIDLTIQPEGLRHNIEKARENSIIIPTIAQMQRPETIPEKIQAKLKSVGLWDVNPLNLFRITWKNEAKESGGLFQAAPNYVEIPSRLSGVPRAATRWAPPSGAWPPGWSPGSLTPPTTTRCGPPRGTTAGAARSTASCWPATAWPFCRRR